MSTFIYPPLQVTIPGVATEATLLQVEANTANTVTELQTANSTLATQATAQESRDFLEIVSNSTAVTEPAIQNIENYTNSLNNKLPSGLVSAAFDYQSIAYVTSGNGIGEIETVIYKAGGAGGTTVATLTLAYDSNNKLISVTKS
jgi:hypothetical protein